MSERFKPHTYDGETSQNRPLIQSEKIADEEAKEATHEQAQVRSILKSIHEPLLKEIFC